MAEPKQVIAIRTDLKMSRGKEISQGAHVAVEAVANNLDDPLVKAWRAGSHTKITVRVESEEELRALYEAAREKAVPCAIVQDEGRTEFHGVRTYTAAAIGPGDPETITALTGHLKLR